MNSLKINNIVYPMQDGFTIKDKHTEELDSATISIPFSDKLNLSPFDFVEIEDDIAGNKYYVVDTWIEETVSFNPLKYTYTINLISETIKLQKIILPNVKITQPIGRTTKKSILKKLQEYFEVYIEPQYSELSLSSELEELTEGIDCPENTYNRPTAFELINSLLAPLNAIVTIKNHEITYIKQDIYGNEIDTSKLYYDNNTQTIKDYANRLDTQVSNGVSTKRNVSTISGITIRGNIGDSVSSDDNMTIILDKPIYDIRNDLYGIYAYFPYIVDGVPSGIAKVDISGYIVEKSIYDTYLTSNASGVITGRYKRNALWYKRGENTINGLGYTESLWLGTTNCALFNILINAVKQISEDAQPYFINAQTRTSVFFGVEYKTSEDFRFIAEKENKYNSTLVDNQIEPQVDANSFGKVEQEKLNRLGNKSRIITATYLKTDTIPELADYIDEYVLAEREITYYNDYVIFKGYLYKDYIMKNRYYGLNSKKRDTQITTEKIIRNDVIRIKCYFSPISEGLTTDYLQRYILMPIATSQFTDEQIMATIDEWYDEYVKYVFVRTYDNDGEYIVKNSGWIVLNASSYSCGKSNVIHIQFMDNISAGISVTTDLSGGTIGGKRQEYVKYADNYGEFKRIALDLYTNKKKDFVENATLSNINDYRSIANDFPYITYNNYYELTENNLSHLFTTQKTLYKDNGEITAITFNIDYIDNEYAIIGSLSEFSGINMKSIYEGGLEICYSTTEKYETGDQFGKGTIADENDVKIDGTDAYNYIFDNSQTFSRIKLSIRSGIDISNWQSWGIVDPSNNKLILGVNKTGASIPTQLYLNYTIENY